MLDMAASEAQDTAAGTVYVLWSVLPEQTVIWTPQQASDSSWLPVTAPPVPSSSNSIGILVSAPLGGAPMAALCAPPVIAPAGTIWTDVPQTYNPQQEAV
jgi:hypothetical protein